MERAEGNTTLFIARFSPKSRLPMALGSGAVAAMTTFRSRAVRVNG